MVEPDFRKLSRGFAELIVKGKARGLDVPQEICDAAIEAWIDVFEPLVVALYAKGQADEAKTTLLVLEDDADGSPNMLRLGLIRAIEIVRARGKR